MIVKECGVETDARQRQLKAFGSPQFPVYCSDVDMDTMDVPWHWHDELELDVPVSGKIRLSVDGREWILEPGEGMFLNTGVVHGIWPASSEHCRLHAIVFHPRLVGGSPESVYWQDYLKPLLSGAMPACFLGRDEAWQQEVLEQFHSAWQSCLTEERGFEFNVRGALSRLVFLLTEHRPALEKRPSEKSLRDMARIKTMLQFIQVHYSQPLTAAQIAQSAAISESECLRCFRNVIGTTPIQYLNQYRVQRAEELLLSTDWKITEIGGQCGFQEMGWFARTFRKLKGCTPSEYRKRNEETGPDIKS